MKRLAILLAALAAAFALVACGGKSAGRIWLTHNPLRFGGLSACTGNCFQATIQWSLNYSGATGYYVYENGTEVADVNTPGWSFSGLACGQSYTLAVKAHNGSGGTGPLVSTSYSSPSCPVTFPLQVSANGRYLETASGSPWLMAGDSPQSTVGDLTLTNAYAYLDNRETNGFNTVWINVLCDDYTYCNANGTTSSATEVGSIAPFTVGTAPSSYSVGGQSTAPYCGDCNSTYFTRVHEIVAHAETDGMEVLLDPAETGGWLPFTEANGDGTISTTNNDYRYGEYLGNEFKDLPNIIWLMGNDFRNVSTAPDQQDLQTVENGIKATDPTALFTLEQNFLSYLSTSDSLIDTNGNDTLWDSFVNLNAVYTYATAQMGLDEAYAEADMPAFVVESNYDGEANGSYDGCNTTSSNVKSCRLQYWWAMTSGAAGIGMYGCHCTTHLGGSDLSPSIGGLSNSSFSSLAATIDTVPVAQMGYAESFWKPLAWQTLVPDTANAVVTSGEGTCPTTAQQRANNATVTSILTVNCVTTTSNYSGTAGSATLAVSYLPDPSSFSSPVVNLADFSNCNSGVTASWYDPTNGSSTPVPGSPFTGCGSHTFTPTSNNSAGDKDWVLELTAAPTGFAVSCPLTFAAGSTGTNSTTPIANDGSGGTCWGQQTGVYAGTGDTVAQIEANPTGLGFTHHTGDLTISTSGTTINKYWVDGGCINVATGVNNVTIENTLVTDAVPDCTLNNEAGAGIHAGGNPPTSTGTLVKDVTVDGAPSGDSLSDTSGIIMDNGTVEQSNVFGFTKGLVSDANTQATPTLYQDNYVHDFQDCSHDDGTWEDGFGWVTFAHNYIYTNDPANAGCATGACVGGSDVGTSGGNVEHDVTYNENFCSGFDGEDGQTGCGGYDIKITNNVMDNTAAKFDAWGGFNSPDFQDSWSGNTQIDHSGTTSTAPDPSSGICSGAVSNSAVPTISGTATHGDTLTAGNGTWSASATFAYQWFDCNTSGTSCVPISGATNSTYPVAVSDEGHTIRVLVIATPSVGSVNQSIMPSAATATVN